MTRLSMFISGIVDLGGALCGRSLGGLERLPVVGAAVTEVGDG